MCFSLQWFEQLLIVLVIVAAVVAILKILVPYVILKLGWSEAGEGVGIVVAVLRIVVWAVIVIFVIYFCFAMISCLLSYGGGLPLLPHR